jgi:type IV/VI secretion system ImpK/VasF family protein
MTLPECCEPLFQWACRLNRAIRKNVAPPASCTAVEARKLLAHCAEQAQTAGIGDAFARIEPVLCYFVDSVGRTSPDGATWPSLAQERGLDDGKEEFFDRLDEALRDQSPEAQQVLAVFYTCLGLGFTGWYAGQPDVLRRKMQDLAARIRPLIDADPTARVTPEAYEHVNTADLTEPPSRRLGAVVIAAAGLAVTLLVANAVAYLQKRSELKGSLDTITQAADPVSSGSESSGGANP